MGGGQAAVVVVRDGEGGVVKAFVGDWDGGLVGEVVELG